MFRVAAVASLICDNFSEPLPKDKIISACLLHDMGNIIKSRLEYFPEFLEPEGLDYWQTIKEEYVRKHGDKPFPATFKIAQELGVSEQILALIDATGFLKATENMLNPSWQVKICAYADMRVKPLGVASLADRLKDLEVRYAQISTLEKEKVEVIHNSLFEIEKQIFSKCKIKPEDINDEVIKPIISELKNFVIK